jgi:hypothetical protein
MVERDLISLSIGVMEITSSSESSFDTGLEKGARDVGKGATDLLRAVSGAGLLDSQTHFIV